MHFISLCRIFSAVSVSKLTVSLFLCWVFYSESSIVCSIFLSSFASCQSPGINCFITACFINAAAPARLYDCRICILSDYVSVIFSGRTIQHSVLISHLLIKYRISICSFLNTCMPAPSVLLWCQSDYNFISSDWFFSSYWCSFCRNISPLIRLSGICCYCYMTALHSCTGMPAFIFQAGCCPEKSCTRLSDHGVLILSYR